ncbi:DUF2142 domain-containing protein [Micromonospora sp. NPDC049523]|uniref:DUF2142 domain-containing protein n=1 Tax=Micromonospora sp. NPDC049523 TaxID=3155921 RepID=UPI003425DE4A
MTTPMAAPVRPHPSTRHSTGLLLRVMLPFAGFFLLFAAWAVATPYDGTPDEMRHIQHAYGVASGDIAPAPAKEGKFPGAYHEVPKSLIRSNCFAHHPDQDASCVRGPGGDDTLVRVLTPAGRYNPAYYLTVGWPLVLSPNMAGVLLARLVSAALVAALFAWATSVALTLRHRLAFGGILVAVTPITAHLAGAVNPNAIEIAAGAAMVVGLIAVLLEPDGAGRRRSAWWLTGVGGAVLLTVRSGGPAWFAVIAAVLLVGLSLPAYRALLRSRRFWILSGALAATGIASVGWTLWKKTAEITPNGVGSRHLSLVGAMKIEIFDRWNSYIQELVGVLGWLDTPLPMLINLAWYFSVGTLVLLALALGGNAARWRVAGLGALGMLVPSVIEAINVNEYAFIGQGRYFLPLLVGVPILAAYTVAESGLVDPLRKLIRLFVVLLVPAHLGALAYTMVRFQKGLPPRRGVISFNVLGGEWHPALGSVTPILLAIVAGAILIASHWRLTAPDRVLPAGPAAEPVGLRPDLQPAERELVDVVTAPRAREERTN